jgi:hypothetical protein
MSRRGMRRARAGRSGGKSTGFFFKKKKQDTCVTVALPVFRHASHRAHLNDPKGFASFFQKTPAGLLPARGPSRLAGRRALGLVTTRLPGSSED